MTTMPAWLAKQRDLPMPRKVATGAIHKQTGLEIRAGLLGARIIGLDGTEFTFPCFFLGDPDAPPSGSQAATPSRKILGLSGVVPRRQWFQGDTSQGRRAEMAIRPRIWPSMASSIWPVGLRTSQRR